MISIDSEKMNPENITVNPRFSFSIIVGKRNPNGKNHPMFPKNNLKNSLIPAFLNVVINLTNGTKLSCRSSYRNPHLTMVKFKTISMYATNSVVRIARFLLRMIFVIKSTLTENRP